MSDDFERAYQNELHFLREMSQEFAEDRPKIADRLQMNSDGTSDDPHVDRLIQSVAFLTARIRLKLDDGFPELTNALLGLLYPHYLNPVPSMGIVKFIVDPFQGDVKDGFRIERSSRLFSREIRGTKCEFRTAYPVDLYPLDVTDASAVERFAAGAPAPTVLVNAVGWVHHGSVLACSDDDWQRSLDVNVTSMFRMIRAFLPGMREARYGSIVNVASVASSVMGVPNRFAYGTTKAAVVGLTKSVAADFVGEGIRCNAICPGTVQSPSLDERIAAFDDPEAARRDFIARQPMGRLGEAEEVAALAVHLGSRESAYTTGAIHVIDGGMSL